ncbi:hypothetical protein ACFJIV_29095 [Mucilaginibacter sp. UC70_90]
MSAEITAVADLLKENFPKTGQIRAFAFGSAVCANKTPNDIDIMIIYVDPTHPQQIRNILTGIGYTPVHLIFLTPEEEIETNFIEKQNCISIL